MPRNYLPFIWNSNLTRHPVILFARSGNSQVDSTLPFTQTRKRFSWEQCRVTGSCCSLFHPQTWRGYLWSLTWIACSVLPGLLALISLPWLYFIPTSSLPPAFELHLALRLITSLQKPFLENTDTHTWSLNEILPFTCTNIHPSNYYLQMGSTCTYTCTPTHTWGTQFLE